MGDTLAKENVKTSCFKDALNELNKSLALREESECGGILEECKSDLIWLWELAVQPEEKRQCIDLTAMLGNEADCHGLLSRFAFTSYEAKDYQTAKHGFLRLAQMGSQAGKNNLAYMARRGEGDHLWFFQTEEILRLLKSGVQEREVFSVINTALVFALLLQTAEDWKFADRLISLLQSGAVFAASWWYDLAARGEAEGYLVHWWLLRHGKMGTSPLGTLEALSVKVKSLYPDIPEDLLNPMQTTLSQEQADAEDIAKDE